VTPAVLSWARDLCHLSLDAAANKIGISETKLVDWEKGNGLPSVNQARILANIYKVPLISFWLDTPPSDIKVPRIRDFRKLPGNTPKDLSYNLTIGVRDATNKRELALELALNLKRQIKSFAYSFQTSTSIAKLSEEIRNILNIHWNEQKEWKEPRIAFNAIKEKIEALDALVLQYSKIDVSEFRGFSIYFKIMPIIGINRADSYAARTFSLIHEFVHLLFGESSVSNASEIDRTFDPNRKIEQICNEVAGATLVPLVEFRDALENIGGSAQEKITAISKLFGVSRETVAMRLFQTNKISSDRLNTLLSEIRSTYKSQKKVGGFVPPYQDFVSKAGKPVARLLVENLSKGHITENDFSAYSGLKIKHIDKVKSAISNLGD